jgi:adenylylsulfate kinase-like enzyme
LNQETKKNNKMIYNFIGQPHSGKTTLARHLRTTLQINNEARLIYMIDGDKLRDLFKNKDYSEVGRRQNIVRAYSIARYLQDLNPFNDIIIAVASPFLDLREELKEDTDVTEIYVHTKNIRGRENFHVVDFEKPITNYIDLDTTDVDELTSLNELLNKIDLLKIRQNGNSKK